MSEPKKFYNHTDRVLSVAQSPPALPMVVVYAWAERDKEGAVSTDHEVFPVVALVTTVRQNYTKTSESSEGGQCWTEKELRLQGWHYEGITSETKPLIIDPEGYSLCEPGEYFNGLSAILISLADAKSLEHVIVAVSALAVRNLERDERKILEQKR